MIEKNITLWKERFGDSEREQFISDLERRDLVVARLRFQGANSDTKIQIKHILFFRLFTHFITTSTGVVVFRNL